MTEQWTHRGIGFFSEEKQAEQAIRALESANFPLDRVSILAKQLTDDGVASGAKTSGQVGGQAINASERGPQNAVTAALWGGLVGGLASLALPGAGVVMAIGAVGGALATAVAGQGVGALATLNLKQGLQSLGIPQAQVGAISDRLLKEDFMVVVDGNTTELSQAEAVLTHQSIQDWHIYPLH
jgi:uncharacterized membrane protein